MKKTINLELSKKLNELGLLDNIETEYCYHSLDFINFRGDVEETESEVISLKEVKKIYNEGNENKRVCGFNSYKTLIIEEAIEFLPTFNFKKVDFKDEDGDVLLKSYEVYTQYYTSGKKKELIFALEDYIEYLLNNNLLKNEN